MWLINDQDSAIVARDNEFLKERDGPRGQRLFDIAGGERLAVG